MLMRPDWSEAGMRVLQVCLSLSLTDKAEIGRGEEQDDEEEVTGRKYLSAFTLASPGSSAESVG